MGNEHGQHHGDDSGNADGNTAHGALHITDLHGLGGTACMAAATNTHSGGDAVLDPQHLDEDGSQNVAEDTGEHHRSHSDRGNSAQLGAQFHGNGCGNRFGQHGKGQSIADPQQTAEQIDTGHRGGRPCQTAQYNGQEVLLQQGQLLVDGVGQQRRCRGEHHGDDVGSAQVVLERDIKHQQHRHDDEDGEQHWVEQRRTGALVNCRHQDIDTKGQGETKQRAVQNNIDHACSSFFLRSMRWITPVTV